MSIGNTVRPSVGVRQCALVWVEELFTKCTCLGGRAFHKFGTDA
jgi:hypothetical protein